MSSKPDSPDQNRPSFIEAVRRAQITECAVECIAELGYANASLAKIAKRADISTGVISYHFASKDELIRAVIAHVFDCAAVYISRRIDPEFDPNSPAPVSGDAAFKPTRNAIAHYGARGALRQAIEAVVGFFAAHRNQSLALLKINLAGGAGTPTEPYDPAIRERRHGYMREILVAGQTDGSFRPFDVRVMLTAIYGAFDAVPRKVATETEVDLATYSKELAELFDRATRAD